MLVYYSVHWPLHLAPVVYDLRATRSVGWTGVWVDEWIGVWIVRGRVYVGVLFCPPHTGWIDL